MTPEPSQPLCTPKAKLSERERQMAWHLFVETWKACLDTGTPNKIADAAGRIYRDCIRATRTCAAIEDEDVS